MIYTIKKDHYIRKLVVEPGDLKAKKKFESYRRRHWKIIGTPNPRLPEKKMPDPVPQKSREKPTERREEHYTIIMGRRILVD